MSDSVSGKSVVIIGATGGIGKAVTELIIKDFSPANLLVISRDAERNKLLVNSLQLKLKGGVNILGFPYDFDNYKLESFSSQLEATGLKTVDHLVFVHTLGLNLKPVTSFSEEEITSSMNPFIPLVSVVSFLVRENYFPKSSTSSITFTSGTLVKRPVPLWSLVALKGGAMIAYSKALAGELAPIRVNTILPGPVETGLWGENREQMKAKYDAELPVGHSGQPDEVVGAYLLCLQSTFVTGTELVIDGGSLL